MHILFKISHSHNAFHAECPAAHKAHLAIEKGFPHHEHLDIGGITLHSVFINIVNANFRQQEKKLATQMRIGFIMINSEIQFWRGQS